MREVFAHEAVVYAGAEADAQAPGAAVTVALCGHWEHEPPCPLAPHHTQATRVGGDLHLRILFAAEPRCEGEVRRRIDAALALGQLDGPRGVATWQLRSSRSAMVAESELAHGQRLVEA